MRLWIVLAALLPGCANYVVPADTRSIDWLTGCWRAERPDGYYQEAWLPPEADGTVGVSREVRGGRTVAWEFLKIELRGHGVVAYIAQPSGQARAEFLLARHQPGRLVFENRAHDYPTLIEYRYVDLNAVTAHIEGANGARPVDYPMQRVDCDG